MCGANTYYEASSKIILFLFAGTDALGWEKLCTEFSPPSARSSKLCINSTDYGKTFTSVIIDLRDMSSVAKTQISILKSEINTPNFSQKECATDVVLPNEKNSCFVCVCVCVCVFPH
jgi:hypothetical protein